MRLQNPFAALAPVGLDSQVLTVLSRSRDHLTADQIHRVLPEHGSLSGVRKSLDRLLRQGIISERAAGHTSGYALNQDHLLINAVLMVADAKSALTTRIRETVQQQFSFEPTLVVMFGSAARGDMSDDSDIDLLFVIPDGVPEEQAEDQLLTSHTVCSPGLEIQSAYLPIGKERSRLRRSLTQSCERGSRSSEIWPGCGGHPEEPRQHHDVTEASATHGSCRQVGSCRPPNESPEAS